MFRILFYISRKLWP